MSFKEFILTEAEVKVHTLSKIQDIIESAGGEIYAVGGPVRDTVLGKEPKDIDFLVRHLTLEEIKKAFDDSGIRSELTGARFGVITARVDDEEYEFAIPRIKEGAREEEPEMDIHAQVKDDLGRRDLTINAMAVPLKFFISLFSIEDLEERKETIKNFLKKHAEHYDPFGGISSIERKELKTSGDPERRFREDAIRMLRAIRFAARTGYNLDPEMIQVMKDKKEWLLENPNPGQPAPSGEAIGLEFAKAWKENSDMEIFIRLLDETGIGEMLFSKSFDPYLISTKFLEEQEGRIFAQFIAFFINGGNYEVIKPTNDMKEMLLISKALRMNKEQKYPPFTIVHKAKTKARLPLLFGVFKQIEPEVADKIAKLTEKPVSIKEIAISGNDIMSLGFKGNQIGIAIEHLLKAIWSDKLPNEREALLKELKYRYEAGDLF